jgi:transposase
LLRLRIFLVRLRTRVKNRIHGTLARYKIQVPGLFGVGPRLELGTRLPELPVQTRQAVEQELATLDFLKPQIESAEQRLEAIMKVRVEADLLKTLPCVGKIISMVLMLEIGAGRSISDSRAFGKLRRARSAGTRRQFHQCLRAPVPEHPVAIVRISGISQAEVAALMHGIGHQTPALDLIAAVNPCRPGVAWGPASKPESLR